MGGVSARSKAGGVRVLARPDDSWEEQMRTELEGWRQREYTGRFRRRKGRD